MNLEQVCAVLCCAVLCCAVLCCAVLYCTVLYCTVLYCTVLYRTVLYCTVLYYTVLYCFVLYCTVSYVLLFLPFYHSLYKYTLTYLYMNPWRSLSLFPLFPFSLFSPLPLFSSPFFSTRFFSSPLFLSSLSSHLFSCSSPLLPSPFLSHPLVDSKWHSDGRIDESASGRIQKVHRTHIQYLEVSTCVRTIVKKSLFSVLFLCIWNTH